MDSSEGKVLVSEVEGTVVGFAKLTEFNVATEKYGCILWLAVHPNYRQKAVASALVKASVDELGHGTSGAVFASVQRRNKASLATFHGQGFEQIGVVKLWRLFSWRTFQFYTSIWYAPGEVVLMHSLSQTSTLYV